MILNWFKRKDFLFIINLFKKIKIYDVLIIVFFFLFLTIFKYFNKTYFYLLFYFKFLANIVLPKALT